MKPLYVDLRASRLLSAWLLGAASVACAAVAMLPWAGGLRVAIVLGLLLCTYYAIRCHAWLRQPGSIVQLMLDGTGLHCRMRNGDWMGVRVQGESFVTPWLCVLLLRPDGARGLYTVVLLPDMLPADDFRRLRVWLRWASQRAEP